MKRNLTFERIYRLGEFKSLRVGEDLIDLPEEILLSPEAVALLRKMQMVDSDLVYQQYYVLTQETAKVPDGKEHESILLEMKANLMDELKTLLSKEKE